MYVLKTEELGGKGCIMWSLVIYTAGQVVGNQRRVTKWVRNVACMGMKVILKRLLIYVIYYSYFHCIMSYGIIFWDHSAGGMRVFRLQKRIIRIMMGSRSRDSCRDLFIDLKILSQPSLFIHHLILFVNKNSELYTTNNEIHNYCTRQRRNLHQRAANLAQYQNGVLYRGVKMYNSLPAHIKNGFHNPKKFETLLKRFLYNNSFYSIEEFFNFNSPK
jgi:hypothetical protein